MFHASALLGTPAANPVVAVCYAETDVRVNDAVFAASNAKPQRGESKYVSRVTNDPPKANGVDLFIGFSLSNVNVRDGHRQVSVGVNGTFTTHADPTDLRRLKPGDYLNVGPPTPAQFLDHPATFHAPTYTVELDPTKYAPLRFLRRETVSTMRVQITKGHVQMPGVFTNKGKSKDEYLALVDEGDNFPMARWSSERETHVEGGLRGDFHDGFLPTWVASQHAWRVFMKMRSWTPAEMLPGPGFVDSEGKRTGVFTMTSPKIHDGTNQLIPFVLMVDARNAVRLVDASSIASGRPMLLNSQLSGKPFQLKAALGQKFHNETIKTAERVEVQHVWEIARGQLAALWDEIAGIAPPYPKGEEVFDTSVRVEDSNLRPLVDQFRSIISTLKQRTRGNLPQVSQTFLAAMEKWFVDVPGNRNAFEVVFDGALGLQPFAVNFEKDDEGMGAARPPEQLTLGRVAPKLNAIDISRPTQAMLDSAPNYGRVWGLGQDWKVDDAIPENVLRGVPTESGSHTDQRLVRWTVDPLYYAKREQLQLPQCSDWVERLAHQEYVQLAKHDPIKRGSIRTGVTEDVVPRLGQTPAWVASTAMGTAPTNAEFDALVD
jgi:hypothetical protein